jgi:hypothetical protein
MNIEEKGGKNLTRKLGSIIKRSNAHPRARFTYPEYAREARKFQVRKKYAARGHF